MITQSQSMYAGEFRHNLDAKNRLTVPSKWRFDGDDKNTYLAFKDPAGCITVYPPAMVAALQEKLATIGMGDQQGQRAITQLLGSSDTFTFDKSGRININERLYRYAGIDKAVVLVGTVNKFSIWDPERYEAYVGEGDADIGEILGKLGL